MAQLSTALMRVTDASQFEMLKQFELFMTRRDGILVLEQCTTWACGTIGGELAATLSTVYIAPERVGNKAVPDAEALRGMSVTEQAFNHERDVISVPDGVQLDDIKPARITLDGDNKPGGIKLGGIRPNDKQLDVDFPEEETRQARAVVPVKQEDARPAASVEMAAAQSDVVEEAPLDPNFNHNPQTNPI